MKQFNSTWLYIKRHNKTGLKYFGKTTQDPYSYVGSGKHWRRHVKLHGNDICTEWAQLFEDEQTLVEFALRFSAENNIVESTEWANLKPENGLDGGDTFSSLSKEQQDKCRELHSLKSAKQVHSKERREKISASMIGNKRGLGNKSRIGQKQSEEEKQNRKKSQPVNPFKGKSHTTEAKEKVRAAMLSRPKLKCSHCSKELDPANFKRYHGDNCKSRIDR